MSKLAIVIPNWNGADSLAKCLDSLMAQSNQATIIVVDNGSTDSSLNILKKYKNIELIKHSVNKGYAGGVNPGLRFAIENKYSYVAAFNNDAVADKNWLSELKDLLDKNESAGIATSKILDENGERLDSTGDYYTNWGLPYPRGRGEDNLAKYDHKTNVFAASGGASLYRVTMLMQIGLFDEDFFAYYEDVDLSFRAQLAGWKVKYVPSAVAYHQIGATSSKMKGFTTYQTLKNLPMLLVKNVPSKYFFKVSLRFSLAYLLFTLRAISRLQFVSIIKGVFMSVVLMPNNFFKRKDIQRTRVIPDEYIWSMMVHDLPPNANALRKLRSCWWSIRGKHE
jgi:GT2 family glycosyltransferase